MKKAHMIGVITNSPVWNGVSASYLTHCTKEQLNVIYIRIKREEHQYYIDRYIKQRLREDSE